MKATTATKLFRTAVQAGTVDIDGHAREQAENAGLSEAFIDAEIVCAAAGELVLNRTHPGRFIGHGRATIMSIVVEPDTKIVTIMLIE